MKTCKSCGQSNLEWVRVNNTWRLADEEGEIHNCRIKTKQREPLIQILATQKEAAMLMFAIDEVMPLMKEGSKNKMYLDRLKGKIQTWIDMEDDDE